ncbi:MAG: hypothetical protein D6754_13625 [Alphaproteobacteria bacterium]|nr:MAG: hypothetical protein D6754_13625 [Alphaproteobacteria bacterium]
MRAGPVKVSLAVWEGDAMRRAGLILLFLLAAAGAVRAQGPAPFAAFERASAEVLNDPHDLAIGPDGRLYVADKFNNRIAILDAETLEVLGSFGDGQLWNVHDISFGPDGRAHIAVTGTGEIAIWAQDGAGWHQVGVLTGLPRTEGALAHSNGRVYVMAGGAGRLIAFEGTVPVAVAGGLYGAHDVAEAPDGSIWVADNFSRRLVQYSADLQLMRVIDHRKYGFIGPRYLDVDPAGRLVVADQEGHRVLLIDPAAGEDGALIGTIGNGLPGKGPNLLDDPEGVAVRGGVYFFADSDNNRVVRYVVAVN